MVNLESEPMPVRLNGEVTVDWDGTVFGGNAFLHETEHKQKFVVGHLDDLHGFDRYWMDALPNDFLLEWQRCDLTACVPGVSSGGVSTSGPGGFGGGSVGGGLGGSGLGMSTNP